MWSKSDKNRLANKIKSIGAKDLEKEASKLTTFKGKSKASKSKPGKIKGTGRMNKDDFEARIKVIVKQYKENV